MNLGQHTFTVTAIDNAGNEDRVRHLHDRCYARQHQGRRQRVRRHRLHSEPWPGQLAALQTERRCERTAAGDCGTANNNYQAFIKELQTQIGKGVDAPAAAIMIADAQYLMAHCS